MRDYLAMSPVGPAAFCHKGGMPVIRQQVNAVLAKCLGSTEFGNAFFNTHSFRIWRASDLSRKGVPPEVIAKLGRWTSDTYKKYIRP